VNGLRVVGKSVPRSDALPKVTGQAIYGADLSAPGMLHGKVYRSPHPHARILSIDTSRARAVPGVGAVLVASDVPAIRNGVYIDDEPILARDKVRYVGEPVALIAATTPDAADEALHLISVEWALLPVLDDPEAALRPGAVLIHEDWEHLTTHAELTRRENLCGYSRLATGDVDEAFRAADVVVRDRFRGHMVHQGYMEPRAALARIEPNGSITVWSSTQWPFDIRDQLAKLFSRPKEQVRVITTCVGGGFGGKIPLGVEHFATLLAGATGRPVKMITSTAEELTASYPRQGITVEIASGVRKDGTLVGRRARAVLDTGAYAGYGPYFASNVTNQLAGPYRIPALWLEGVAVYTNKTNCGAYRAPTAPKAVFALESHMDRVAQAIDMDPVEFRRRNIYQEGDVAPSGWKLEGVGLGETLEKAARAIGWGEPLPPWRGKGVACAWWATGGGSSSVVLTLNRNGTLSLASGNVEMGTGALTAGVVQILAEEMAVEPEDVSLITGDTDATPYDFGAQASRTVFSVGNAVIRAAEDLRRQLLALAGELLDVKPGRLEVSSGAVRVRGEAAAARAASYAALAEAGLSRGTPLIGRGSYIAPAPDYDPSVFTTHLKPYLASPSFHTHACEVEVDPETGEVRVLRYVVAQDVGFAITPQYVEGQIEGGVVQGLGFALSEEIVMRGGHVLNPNLTDYKMPTILDVPPITTILVEHPAPLGPYGAKNVAEPPCIPVAAAVANAVYHAAGVRVTETPITAERVLRAIRARATSALER